MEAHLVDGTYELFRAFYGPPGALAPDGREVGATRALMRSLLSLIDAGATHVGVAFDHVIESFRNDLFAGYKTGAGIEPALLGQFELAETAVRALGMVVWPMVEFEADDALATAAARLQAEPRVERILLCSPDKDLAQCVSGARVVVLDRRRDKILDEAGVIEKFGVPPASIPDWLALVGDTADGIPGVPRWGERSAAAVLAVHRSIASIPDDPGRWTVRVRGAAALADSLRAHRAQAELYRRLATLRTDVPLQEGLADLEWRGALREPMRALSLALGDEAIRDRVPRWRE